MCQRKNEIMNKEMKIGILTQPLKDNYGGLLQAYALKEVLQSLGHEVIIIDRQKGSKSFLKDLASNIKSKLIGRKKSYEDLLSAKEKSIISQNTIAFRKKYIPKISELFTKDKDMKKLNNMGFDAFIVGSDQSWRPRYSPSIRNYFFDFAKNDKNIKRISYAVSFGVSDWEFSARDTKVCASLAKKFDAISVRENSGVKLVNDYFGMEAVHLVDPTMLLTVQHYQNIIKQENIKESDGELKVYVLDISTKKQKFINSIADKLGLKQFQIMPHKRLKNSRIDIIDDFIFPNPAKWLRGYQDAKFVIADSFHGTVFAILFNIPFLALGNERRGMARFESLLKMFELEDRLITNLDNIDVDKILEAKIDWNRVNQKIDLEKEKSLKYLSANLSTCSP